MLRKIDPGGFTDETLKEKINTVWERKVVPGIRRKSKKAKDIIIGNPPKKPKPPVPQTPILEQFGSELDGLLKNLDEPEEPK